MRISEQISVLRRVGSLMRTVSPGFVIQKQSSPSLAARSALAADLTWFNAYHPYTTHLTWLNELRAQFPTRSKIVTSGTSVQGRTITGIHIFGSTGGGSRPAILFHGNTHAREWISSKVRFYFV